MTVENFVRIVWTVFEKFEIFMKKSGEKNETIGYVVEIFFSKISKWNTYTLELSLFNDWSRIFSKSYILSETEHRAYEESDAQLCANIVHTVSVWLIVVID